MKYRWVDRIESYSLEKGISGIHAVSFEAILQSRQIGEAGVPVAYRLAFVQELAGYFYAAQTQFKKWAMLTSVESISFPTISVHEPWHVTLEEVEKGKLCCSGVVEGMMCFEMIDLDTIYNPEERLAMFKALRGE